LRALEWLHANRRDPNGRYGTLWGRGGVQTGPLSTWHLNENAAVARSFLYAAITELIAGDFNADGLVDGADLARWTTSFGTGPQARLAQGDANRDGRVDGVDHLVWQRNAGRPSTAAPAQPVPEPSAALLLTLLCSLLAIRRRAS
jgi:hypothetical protein